MAEPTSSTLTIERHELKYAIPKSLVDPISTFLNSYCDLDEHSSASADNNYVIQSLYFDTRTLQFLQQRMYGKDGRFNIRVRSYGEHGNAPFYLEIKQKTGTMGRKYRAIVGEDEWPRILVDPSYRLPPEEDSTNAANKSLFLRTAIGYDIRPHILTRYKRKAFVSNVDSYARVTLDTNMTYRLQDSYSLTPEGDMFGYDNETIYGDFQNGPESVILELKCNIGEVPMWMIDLISVFGLQQQGFSKYLNSSLVAHLDDAAQYMNRDRKSV